MHGVRTPLVKQVYVRRHKREYKPQVHMNPTVNDSRGSTSGIGQENLLVVSWRGVNQ